MNPEWHDPTAADFDSKKFLRFGTDTPQCAKCKNPDYRTLGVVKAPGKASATILCQNCKRKRGKPSPKTSAQKVRRFADAGYFTPVCVICNEPNLQILELDHLDGKANSDRAEPLCANHHAIKSYWAEHGPMAALRTYDPGRRALVYQAAFEFGLAAILALFAAWEGGHEETARVIFFGVASAGLFAWATWNLVADEHFALVYGGDYDRAPFERGLMESKALPWSDYRTGEPVSLDWEGNAFAGTIPVTRLDEFISGYERHAESKAAAPDGTPANKRLVEF